jgi:hypothetical protein
LWSPFARPFPTMQKPQRHQKLKYGHQKRGMAADDNPWLRELKRLWLMAR